MSIYICMLMGWYDEAGTRRRVGLGLYILDFQTAAFIAINNISQKKIIFFRRIINRDRINMEKRNDQIYIAK